MLFESFIPGNWAEIVIRLTLAVIFGGIIGIERVLSNHDAGLRTHILVSLGAAGIMVLSQTVNMQYGGDIARMGAQVVSGIGFLGAGCIIVTGGHIRGLTSAAGLWTTACVGLCVGMGYYFISFTITGLMMVAMFILRPLATKLQQKHGLVRQSLKITLDNRDDMKHVTGDIYESGLQICSVAFENDTTVRIEISSEDEADINHLMAELASNSRVTQVTRN